MKKFTNVLLFCIMVLVIIVVSGWQPKETTVETITGINISDEPMAQGDALELAGRVHLGVWKIIGIIVIVVVMLVGVGSLILPEKTRQGHEATLEKTQKWHAKQGVPGLVRGLDGGDISGTEIMKEKIKEDNERFVQPKLNEMSRR